MTEKPYSSKDMWTSCHVSACARAADVDETLTERGTRNMEKRTQLIWESDRVCKDKLFPYKV